MRLHVLVEGQTEEQFIRSVVAPHLQMRGIWAFPQIVETSRDRAGKKRAGGGDWQKWRRDILRLTREQRGAEVRFTTMFDLYRLPDEFPGLREHAAVRDTARRVELLEAALAADIQDERLIPYLQRHEFEALVLASLDALADVLDPGERPGLASLRVIVASVPPEDVDDGPETAPSKRIVAAIPSYRKTLHGSLAVEATGLAKLRAACPRFDGWVGTLERLSGEGGP
jgi:hypothetical protein